MRASNSKDMGTDHPYQESEPQPKLKKLPACASCKHRRVLCNPVPAPGSCSRCLDKGIVCQTLPTVRKKAARSGKRIEEARAIFGASDPALTSSALPSATPWVDSNANSNGTRDSNTSALMRTQFTTPFSQEDRLATTELTAHLAAHLLDLYQYLPQSWLPISSRGKVLSQFEAVGRRLDALPPQVEILAHTIIALTSRLSSHPFIVGAGAPAPPFEQLNTAASSLPDKDLRIFGVRRSAVCERLKESAIRMAWERGTLVVVQEESMAASFLLEMLAERSEFKGGTSYGSSYVSHLRILVDKEEELGIKLIQNQSLGWSSLIMREALAACNAGRTSNFTETDDLLLCGETPSALDQAVMESSAIGENIDVRDSVTLFFRPMRPYTFHTARLARECSTRLTGTSARRLPFDELYASKFLTSLDHLYALLTILRARISYILSPAATLAHSLPAPFERDRVFIMKSCLHTLELAWASLTLPIYIEIKRRVELLNGLETLTAEKKRLRERLLILQSQIHQITLVGAKIVAAALVTAPSLAFLTHLQQERIPVWATIILETKTLEEGFEGITRKEKIECLIKCIDGLKMIGWSWSKELEIIDTKLEGALNTLQLEEMLQSNTNSAAHNRPPFNHPTPAPPSNSIFGLSPTTSTATPNSQPLNHIFGLTPPENHQPHQSVESPSIDFNSFFNSTNSNNLSEFDFGALLNEEGIPDGMKLDEWTNV